MTTLHSNPSAGSAEPYWFEWQTGLLSLVEMLDEDSEIVAVAFQLHGTKGWDDVGVRYSSGRTRLLQMKHSRTGDTLTFGDLIATQENTSPSLLRALAQAWKSEQAVRGNVECVLVTNRRAGPNWYSGRPPLGEFFAKIKERVSVATAPDAISWQGEDQRYPAAWTAFLEEINDLDPQEQMSFLRSLEIETSAPDLADLEEKVHERLTKLTGLPHSSAKAIFNTLHANLRKWTCHSRRDAEWIDRETLKANVASDEPDPIRLGTCQVETPEPFFPSRLRTVDILRESLLSDSKHKIDFLSAEPGAGKTSCTSRLARNGAMLWQEQCISVRYYAYQPIVPGRTEIPSDTDGSDSQQLWLVLLWQIRDQLRKSKLLAELSVPVWLAGMPWQVARGHVLRLGDALGARWGRPFILCIDGIDHAARARRKRLPEFLQTLPSPEVIPAHVRVFIAGQPAESYPEYPIYLRCANKAVKVHSLGDLLDEDIRLLWRAAHPRIAQEAEDAVLRLLIEKTHRRTLPVVYAVEEIRDSSTLDQAAALLDARPLSDSLHDYYDKIWSSAVATEGNRHRMAAAFALLQERPTGDLMASAFSELGKPALDWKDNLRGLRPLVRETSQGFELVHNDLRVHLDARLTGDLSARQDAASAFANHYRKPSSDRLAAHRSLLALLTDADRQAEFGEDFTVDWVIEAGSLGLPAAILERECSIAFHAVIIRRDWLLLHSVGCAALTLHRLNECVTEWSHNDDPLARHHLPAFLPVEGEPQPLELWTVAEFSELVCGCESLVNGGALERAAVVLQQWVGEIPLDALIRKLVATTDSEQQLRTSGKTLRPLFKRFGRLSAICGVPFGSPNSDSEENSKDLAAAEMGWVQGLAERTNRRSALRLWCSRRPRYLSSWIAAVKAAAAQSRWGEARALMSRIAPTGLEPEEGIYMAWHAARARPSNGELWLQPFTLPNYGFTTGQIRLPIARILAQWATYSNSVKEPAQVADELHPLLEQRGIEDKNPAAVRLLLRGSALLGQLLRYRDNGDLTGAAVAVPPSTVRPYLEALWCCQPDWRNLPHEEMQTPGEIGRNLAEIAWDFGPPYRQLLHELAVARFPNVISSTDGLRIFEMLLALGERARVEKMVTSKAEEVLKGIHEHEVTSRNATVGNLLDFLHRLEMPELRARLNARLAMARLGYGSHKEWVFAPLARWLRVLRKHSPSVWKSDGMQILALDLIADLQGADNRHSDEILAEVGAAAMQCGPCDLEALLDFFAKQGTKYPLWTMARAAKGGMETLLRDEIELSEESALSLATIAIAVGRWPSESPLSTVRSILSADGVPPRLAQQSHWQRAVRIAAEIQGLPAAIQTSERHPDEVDAPQMKCSSEEILARILRPSERHHLLQNIAALAEQVKSECHPNRADLISTAIGTLESAGATSRYIYLDNIRLMSRLSSSLTEPELWRVLDAITAITGCVRTEVSDATWAFPAAFLATDLACQARAEQAGRDFAETVFRQLIGMHWKWHGIPPSTCPIAVSSIASTWSDAVRRVLFTLTQTEGCETLYMAMSGMRFFAEVFPSEIPNLCREGLGDNARRDAILPLAQLWATRHPRMLRPMLRDFEALEVTGSLQSRLDAWAVGALYSVTVGESPRVFPMPAKGSDPEMVFPGDKQLFEIEPHVDGLSRHRSFAGMANERLRRAGRVLGSMTSAFRHLVLALRKSPVPEPSFHLRSPEKLAFDSTYPRPLPELKDFVGDAILHQCAGQLWSPRRTAAVRLLIGYGMDPWIATATPNPWPETKAWPSGFDIERWNEAHAPETSEVALRIKALLEGEDLAPEKILLGAVLRIPTYRRDLEFRYWLANSIGEAVSPSRAMASTPSGRTLSNWLSGWSFAANRPASPVTVQFAGGLIDHPNCELSVTPTDEWTGAWGWLPDPENALKFRMGDGGHAAWYERWIGPEINTNRTYRQPLLERWVAIRTALPSGLGELRAWRRHVLKDSNLLEKPE